MGAIHLLTAKRGVQRKIFVESLQGQPELANLAMLDSLTSSALVIRVDFQLRNSPSHYVTECPKLDKEIGQLPGSPTQLTLRAQRWGQRPKFTHILDLTRPTLVVTTTQGSREVGHTPNIEVLSAQIDLGRNPVIWLRW